MTKILIDKAVVRQALEALENAWLDASMGKGDVARHTEAIAALRQAIADAEQPAQQEPVAFCEPSDPDARTAFSWPGLDRQTRHTLSLYTAPQAQPAREPDPDELTIAYMSGLYEGKKIGAKEEREACAKVCEHQPHWVSCAAAIRARGK